MNSKSAVELITFGGKYPDSILSHARTIAVVAAPYDALLSAEAGPGDSIALYELMDLEGFFTDELIEHIQKGANEINDYDASQTKLCRSSSDRRHHNTRFNGALAHIRQRLTENGFQISSQILNEMIANANHTNLSQQILQLGILKTKAVRLKRQHDQTLPARAIATSNRGFTWYEIAESASRQPQKLFKSVSGTLAARDILKTIDLDLQYKSAVPAPYDFSTQLGVPHLHFYFIRSANPLSLCRLVVFNSTSKRIVTTSEVTRGNGDITFSGCSFLPVTTAFNTLNATRAYLYLKDMVTISLFELLIRGTIKEREYISDTRLEADETPNAIDTALQSPVTTELERENEDEPVITAEIPREETVPNNKAAAPIVVGKNRLNYRNILSALFRFGVSIDKSGRHVKLRLGERTTPFLNRHQNENPHHNLQTLRRALDALGIPETTFFAEL